MLVLDPSIDVPAVQRLVRKHYGDDESLTFVPLGGDSWCFATSGLWVSVRRDRGGHCSAAYLGAVELARQGLDFVLAPLEGSDGQVIHHAGGRPVVVFQYRPGHELWGSEATPEQAVRIMEMIGLVHRSSVTQPIPQESFSFPHHEELERGVGRAIEGAGAAGPYGERVTQLVRENRTYLEEMHTELRELEARLAAGGTDGFVVTHGEPSNVLLTDDGELLLVDWGSMAFAPPERDWFDVRSYPAALPPCRPVELRFYELCWTLGEIAEYVHRLTDTHEGDALDDDRWAQLRRYL